MKIFYSLTGYFFLALGAVGIFLPILPAIPFLLAASFFLAKSSPRFRAWLLSSKLYRRYSGGFAEKPGAAGKRKISIWKKTAVTLFIASVFCRIIRTRVRACAFSLFEKLNFLRRHKRRNRTPHPLMPGDT